MHRGSNSDFELQKARPISEAFYTVVNFMIIDVLFYGLFLPLLATYIGGNVAKGFSLCPKYELAITVIMTFFLLYTSFSVFGESSYWKHLLALDDFYANLLQIRDIVNFFILTICLLGLASTIEQMIGDKAMKMYHMSEGTGYVVVKTLFEWVHIDTSVLPSLGLSLPHEATLTDPNFGENEQFLHAATFMLFWAMVSACVAKLIYFNTLFTFLRAVTIFVALNPVFDDADYNALSRH